MTIYRQALPIFFSLSLSSLFSLLFIIYTYMCLKYSRPFTHSLLFRSEASLHSLHSSPSLFGMVWYGMVDEGCGDHRGNLPACQNPLAAFPFRLLFHSFSFV